MAAMNFISFHYVTIDSSEVITN